MVLNKDQATAFPHEAAAVQHQRMEVRVDAQRLRETLHKHHRSAI
jgi:hypothetical protein